MSHIQDWTTEHVAKWFSTIGCEQYTGLVIKEDLDGALLVKLKDQEWLDFGIKNSFHRKKIISKVTKLLEINKSDPTITIIEQGPNTTVRSGQNGQNQDGNVDTSSESAQLDGSILRKAPITAGTSDPNCISLKKGNRHRTWNDWDLQQSTHIAWSNSKSLQPRVEENGPFSGSKTNKVKSDSLLMSFSKSYEKIAESDLEKLTYQAVHPNKYPFLLKQGTSRSILICNLNRNFTKNELLQFFSKCNNFPIRSFKSYLPKCPMVLITYFDISHAKEMQEQVHGHNFIRKAKSTGLSTIKRKGLGWQDGGVLDCTSFVGEMFAFSCIPTHAVYKEWNDGAISVKLKASNSTFNGVEQMLHKAFSIYGPMSCFPKELKRQTSAVHKVNSSELEDDPSFNDTKQYLVQFTDTRAADRALTFIPFLIGNMKVVSRNFVRPTTTSLKTMFLFTHLVEELSLKCHTDEFMLQWCTTAMQEINSDNNNFTTLSKDSNISTSVTGIAPLPSTGSTITNNHTREAVGSDTKQIVLNKLQRAKISADDSSEKEFKKKSNQNNDGKNSNTNGRSSISSDKHSNKNHAYGVDTNDDTNEANFAIKNQNPTVAKKFFPSENGSNYGNVSPSPTFDNNNYNNNNNARMNGIPPYNKYDATASTTTFTNPVENGIQQHQQNQHGNYFGQKYPHCDITGANLNQQHTYEMTPVAAASVHMIGNGTNLQMMGYNDNLSIACFDPAAFNNVSLSGTALKYNLNLQESNLGKSRHLHEQQQQQHTHHSHHQQQHATYNYHQQNFHPQQVYANSLHYNHQLENGMKDHHRYQNNTTNGTNNNYNNYNNNNRKNNLSSGKPRHHGRHNFNINKRSQDKRGKYDDRKNGKHGGKNNNKVILNSINNGVDTRCTLCMKNIPNRLTKKHMLEFLDLHFKRKYDYFYLPVDFKTDYNVGYCFINFLSVDIVKDFYTMYHGRPWATLIQQSRSAKVVDVCYANQQGKRNMIKRQFNSKIRTMDDKYQPSLFHDGETQDFATAKKLYHIH